ncbi:sentrin/sumo-specific protease [Anaeramoeba flamelloides]|uniref:Sentrin/sumo-specific protease n=1 Tax=Anaeramoeba flamelloides TaxID=1746091 RepID=A0ABQ8XFE8_9EUKA|nr:sentrin/sumo-specific protease [Anaeramoeba flamelloides]
MLFMMKMNFPGYISNSSSSDFSSSDQSDSSESSDTLYSFDEFDLENTDQENVSEDSDGSIIDNTTREIDPILLTSNMIYPQELPKSTIKEKEIDAINILTNLKKRNIYLGGRNNNFFLMIKGRKQVGYDKYKQLVSGVILNNKANRIIWTHTEHAHSILIVVDFISSEVYCLDSLQNYFPDYVDQLINSLIGFLVEISPKIKLKRMFYNFNQGRKNLQEDGNSCGVYVCLFIELLCFQKIPIERLIVILTKDHGPLFRKDLFLTLFNIKKPRNSYLVQYRRQKNAIEQRLKEEEKICQTEGKNHWVSESSQTIEEKIESTKKQLKNLVYTISRQTLDIFYDLDINQLGVRPLITFSLRRKIN